MRKYTKTTIILSTLIALGFSAIAEDQVQSAKIVEVEDSIVKAEFQNLKEEAKSQGFDSIYIEGKVKEKYVSKLGVRTLNIDWIRVTDKVTDEKVYLDKHLETTNLKVRNELEPDDIIFISGDMDSLVIKQQELIIKNSKRNNKHKKDKKDSEEEKKKESGGSGIVSNGAGYTPSSQPSEDDEAVFNREIEGEARVVVTADGCTIVASKETMEANQYKRILKDGEEIQPCSPSEIRYALTKDYTTCSPEEDLDAKKAYKRYTLGYKTSKEDSRIVIDGGYCNVDESSVVEMQSQECGREVDFSDSKYYTKKTLKYQMGGKDYVAQSCIRDDESVIEMQKDIKTCKPSFEGGFYTPFFNWFIQKEGVYTSLSECLPDVDRKQKLEEEICTDDKRYSIDNDNHEARLNKTFFYKNEDDEKVLVKQCVASDVVYNFKTEVDNETCPFENNDDTKETLQKGYYFFNGLDDERIDIKDRCHAVLPAIPYTKSKDKWVRKSQSNQVLNINPSDRTFISNLALDENLMKKTDWWFINYGTGPRRTMYNEKTNRLYSMYDHDSDREAPSSYCSITGKIQGDKYCITNTIDKPWALSNGIEIDYEYSTEKPVTNNRMTIASDFKTILMSHYKTVIRADETKKIHVYGNGHRLECSYYRDPKNKVVYIQYQCNNPVCDVSRMQKVGIYQRGDNTEFIDNANILEEKYVCGDGQTLLDLNGAE